MGAAPIAPPGRRLMVALATGVLLAGTLVVGPAAPARAATCPRGHVALTFDDGPSAQSTAKLVRILKRKHVRATFFMVGRAVDLYPARARLVSRHGHKIYNHTYTHPYLTKLSNAAVRRQILQTRRALDRAGVRHGPLLRPPFGAVNARVRRVARNAGHRTVLWTWDPRDWASGRTATQIVRSVMRGLRPGADILLHDHERKATVRALPRIIKGVRARGYCLGVVDRYGRVVPRRQAP